MPIRDPALTPESIRAAMAIPSTDRMRGLKDGVGFATTPEAMAAVVRASKDEPTWVLGPSPQAPWVGAICPHDDYLYAGRVYRKALEGITAKTVIVVGVFHGYRKFQPDSLRFDTYESWWTPDGPVRVSPLRKWMQQWRTSMLRFVEDAAHDLEHSIEPIVAWLRHGRPDREILPVLVPALPYDFLWFNAAVLAQAAVEWARHEGLEWGRDIAVVISADAIHYGADFQELRYGEGTQEAHELAAAEDRRILTEVMQPAGLDVSETAFRLMELLLDDPWRPDAYRWTWCGRYSIPFGLELIARIASEVGKGTRRWPLAYETSISAPRLDVHMPPLGFTAPASYEHFVGYPAVAFTFASTGKT